MPKTLALLTVAFVIAASLPAATQDAGPVPRCGDANKVVALGDGPCPTRRSCCDQQGRCYCC